MKLVWFSGACVSLDATKLRGCHPQPKTVGVFLLAYALAVLVALEIKLPISAAIVSLIVALCAIEAFLLFVLMLRSAHFSQHDDADLVIPASPLMLITVVSLGLIGLLAMYSISGQSINAGHAIAILAQWVVIAEAAAVFYAAQFNSDATPSRGTGSHQAGWETSHAAEKDSEQTRTTIIIPGNDPIPCRDIRLISAEGDYLRVHIGRTSFLVRARMKDVLPQIPDKFGIQIHRSCWVAVTEINRLRRLPGRQIAVEIDLGKTIGVARARQRDVTAKLAERGLNIGSSEALIPDEGQYRNSAG